MFFHYGESDYCAFGDNRDWHTILQDHKKKVNLRLKNKSYNEKCREWFDDYGYYDMDTINQKQIMIVCKMDADDAYKIYVYTDKCAHEFRASNFKELSLEVKHGIMTYGAREKEAENE